MLQRISCRQVFYLLTAKLTLVLRNSFIRVVLLRGMVVQYCKTYTGRADGETGFTDRTNGTVREDIYGS